MLGKKRKSNEKLPFKGKRHAPDVSPAETNGVELDDGDQSEDELELDHEEGGQYVEGIYIPPAPKPACSHFTTGPRLMITHMVVENFKSYAGKVTLGPFQKSFSAVVGPNGSGKSNVIDAMLFVFGYRSTKIRSKKISVLIHNSSYFKSLTFASVAVHFVQIDDQGGDNYSVIPNTEFVISRKAFKDNSSSYYINYKKCQFKDVNSLLLSHGIDLVHNRFLILQGEVEQIAMMKGKAENEHETGLLEYLEDIIGTSRYKEPSNLLNEKTEQLSAERQEKFNRLKKSQKDVEDIEEPMKESLNYLRTSNDITRITNKIFQINIFGLGKKLTQLEEEKEEKEKSFSELKEKLKNLQEAHALKEKEAAEVEKNLEKSVANKERDEAKFRQIELKCEQYKEDISRCNKQRKKATESLKQDEQKLVELKKVPEKNAAEIEELTELSKTLMKDREAAESAVEKAVASLHDATKDLQEEKDSQNNKLIPLKKAMNEIKSKYDLAKVNLDMYLRNENSENTKLENFKDALKSCTERLSEQTKMLSEIEDKLPKSEKLLAESEKELMKVKMDAAALAPELNRARTLLNDKKINMQSSQSRNRVLDFLMKQKASGKLPGVYGRLGDLGGIDAKYDVAISSGCGTLDFIVVDTVSTGNECIDLLKRHDMGRANFIVLEKQQHLRSRYQAPLKTPENVPRLFDLITVADDDVRPAFYFALRDTLVTSDLVQGRRVAYGATRYRVVTLLGEVIEIAGTMIGGGRTVIRGKMGTSAAVETSPAEMAKLEADVETLNTRSAELAEKRVSLESTIMNLQRDIKQWKGSIDKIRLEVKKLQANQPELKQQIKEQEKVVASVASNPKMVKKMNDEIDQLKQELDDATKDVNEIEQSVKKLTKKITDTTEHKMKSANTKLNAVVTQLEKVNKDISKLKVGIASNERNIKKCMDRIESYQEEISTAEDTMKKTNEESKRLQEEGNALVESCKEFLAQIDELQESLKEIKKEVTVLVKDEAALKTEKVKADQILEKVNENIKSAKSSLNNEKEKLKNLKLHDIPGNESESPLVTFLPEELETEDLNKLTYEKQLLCSTISDMKYDPQIIRQYNEKVAITNQRRAELDEITARRDLVRKKYFDVRKARVTEFMNGFAIISFKLKEIYQMLTVGGDAELEVVDTLDPFSEGINFSVRPPRKSWKNISNLSGGEKTLSSLALVFALHYYKPSPLYVMDEIDAALDYVNTTIIGHYIKERTRNTQFLVISLRMNMIELAENLVGIFKTNFCSRTLTINPQDFLKQPAAQQHVPESQKNIENPDNMELDDLN